MYVQIRFWNTHNKRSYQSYLSDVSDQHFMYELVSHILKFTENCYLIKFDLNFIYNNIRSLDSFCVNVTRKFTLGLGLTSLTLAQFKQDALSGFIKVVERHFGCTILFLLIGNKGLCIIPTFSTSPEPLTFNSKKKRLWLSPHDICKIICFNI